MERDEMSSWTMQCFALVVLEDEEGITFRDKSGWSCHGHGRPNVLCQSRTRA